MKINYSDGDVTPEEVVKYLALSGQAQNIFTQIIIAKEVIKKAELSGITPSDEALQDFSDSFREMRGLDTAEETYRFLQDAGLSEEDFESFCESAVLVGPVRETLADEKKVREFFINNRPDFDTAVISVIVVSDESLANEILMQITEDGADFHKLARTYSIDEETKNYGGYVGEVTRAALVPEISAKVFNASAGDVLGPFRGEDFQQLVLVEKIVKAELNDVVIERIKNRLFYQWVSQFTKDGIKTGL
ncbi:MAG: peptidylprolyl isomerase [Nitrospirae bacterium]|nr:peptidylprolyl isomerase [Nitrospirota bacterium]